MVLICNILRVLLTCDYSLTNFTAKIFSRHPLLCLIHVLAVAQGSAPGNTSSFSPPSTSTHIPFLSFSNAPFPLMSPSLLLQGTQHRVSLGRTLQAVPACLKNQRSPPHPRSQRAHFSHFLACSLRTVRFSRSTSSRLPGTAGQGGTDMSSHLHYIHPHPPCLSFSAFSISL